MLTILVIIGLVIIIITSLIFILVQFLGLGNEQLGKGLVLAGEYFLCISACLFFIVNTNILGGFSDGNAYVMRESLKGIALHVDKIERKINSEPVSAYERADTKSTLDRINDIEKQVEGSDLQVKVANTATGLISMIGTILMFSGKLIKQRNEGEQ